jgi:hypothetical protein
MITEKEMQSETTRAANALDVWELPKASYDARMKAKKFYYDPYMKFWYWLYWTKIVARMRAEKDNM